MCIFAYGQTGAGKTHTMYGRCGEASAPGDPEAGLGLRAVDEIWNAVRATTKASPVDAAVTVGPPYAASLCAGGWPPR